MSILYVTDSNEIKNIDISPFSLLFLVDRNDRLSKQLSKQIDIVTFGKNGNMIHSNIPWNLDISDNLSVLNYFVFRKHMIKIKFQKEKDYLVHDYQSKKKTDKIFYKDMIKIIYNFAIQNQDIEKSKQILQTVDQEIEEAVFNYIEYVKPNFNEKQKIYFRKAFKIYQCLLYGLLSHLNKNSKYLYSFVFSLLDAFILFLLIDIVVNYQIEPRDIEKGEFTREFLKILFRLFNEKINHANRENILHYFKVAENDIKSLEYGKRLDDIICYY